MTTESTTTALRLADLPRSWQTSVRLVAYLLRSLVGRIRRASKPDDYRMKKLPEELASAIHGEHRDGMWATTWLDRLAARWGVSLAGDEHDVYPLAAWLPEGRVSWIVAGAVIERSHLSRLTADAGSFLASFATMPRSDDDEALLSALEASAEIVDPWLPPMPRALLMPHRHVALWQQLAPMSHGADEKDGNNTRFRVERAFCPLLRRFVDRPFYAGNAWRGQARDLIAFDLAELLDLDPREWAPAFAHSLFSGGSVEAGASSNGANVGARRALRALFPIVDLLGGCYDNEVMDGMLRAMDALPLCRETAASVVYLVAPEVAAEGEDAVRAWSERLPWAADLYETRQITKHHHRELDPATAKDGADKSEQMLVRTEVMVAGTTWVHGIALAAKDRLLSPLTESVFARAAFVFARASHVGAQSARGLGLFATDGYAGIEEGADALYLAHVGEHRDEIIAALTAVKSSGKAIGGKRGKASGAKAPDDADVTL